MEKTQLTLDLSKQILQNIYETKLIVQKQTHIFGNILIHKIGENYEEIDKERLKGLFLKTFTSKISEEIDSLFDNYQSSEIEFYANNLKTADLIFNTLTDKRTQVIYLENILKRVNQKNEKLETIFTESSRYKNLKKGSSVDMEEIDSEEYLSINNMLEQFVQVIVKNPHLSIDETVEFEKLVTHYYDIYKNDVLLSMNKLLLDNRNLVVMNIENEIDNRELRNGKTSAVSKIEKGITSNSLKVMEELLINTISKYKENAKLELRECSSAVVDLIFRLLPDEYNDQKGLLEVIVDTNINERLGKLLDAEIKKLADNLHSKNQDIIENELYEEKRYKNITDYECDFDLVEKVYRDVLHEIRIAYDIPERIQQSKKLDLLVLGESNSTKIVFKSLTDHIKFENRNNLNEVIIEMHELSEKACNRLTKNDQSIANQKGI